MTAAATAEHSPFDLVKYSIWFVDTGIGGLAFLYDAYPELNMRLKELATRYNVAFELIHFGDQEKGYTFDDSAQSDDVRYFTERVSTYALRENADICVLACNTASAEAHPTLERDLKRSLRTFIPIIEESAEALYAASSVENGVRTIGVFATPPTVKSQIYKRALEAIHARKGGGEDRGERLNVISIGTYWADQIDNGIMGNDQGFVQEINADVKKMIASENGKPISACGLFCTHFPIIGKEIQAAFVQNGHVVPLISQGKLLVGRIVEQVEADLARKAWLKKDRDEHRYGDEEESVGVVERKPLLDLSEIPDLRITSRETGEQQGRSNAEIVAQTARIINETLSKLTEFIKHFPDRRTRFSLCEQQMLGGNPLEELATELGGGGAVRGFRVECTQEGDVIVAMTASRYGPMDFPTYRLFSSTDMCKRILMEEALARIFQVEMVNYDQYGDRTFRVIGSGIADLPTNKDVLRALATIKEELEGLTFQKREMRIPASNEYLQEFYVPLDSKVAKLLERFTIPNESGGCASSGYPFITGGEDGQPILVLTVDHIAALAHSGILGYSKIPRLPPVSSLQNTQGVAVVSTEQHHQDELGLC